MDLPQFIQKISQQIESIETKSQLAWWNLATTGDESFTKELQEAQIALRHLYSSSEDYNFLKNRPPHPDPLIERQAILLLNSFREYQIPQEMIEKIVHLETEIESIYTNFRPTIRGQSISNNELKEIFAESVDSKIRQEAWEASKLIGQQVESKIHELIKLRNESAKKAGFTDFYAMRLELQELDQTRVFDLLDQLYHDSNHLWDVYKNDLDGKLSRKFGIKPHEMKPWHYQDPFFQEAPRSDLNLDQFYANKDLVAISKLFYQSIQLPVDDILARSDLFEREGKSQHAFCTTIDRKQDVRILCNIRDREYWMSTQLHELGHAVYDKYIDPSLPYLLRTYSHISLTESIAMLFGRFSKSGLFLQSYCEVDSQSSAEVNQKGQQQTAAALLVFIRWALVMIYFERAMYQEKGKDLNKHWWELVEKFQGISGMAHRQQPDWASKLHLACAPVYYQNYVLGEMIASQLNHHIKVHYPPSTGCISPEAGKWLKNTLFKLGAQHPWETTLQKVTHEILTPGYFIESINE